MEDAGGEEDHGEAADECDLGEAEKADPDHLASEQVSRPHRGHDHLDDAVRLLLDDAGQHPLAVDGDGREQQRCAEHCGHHLCIARLRFRRLECDRVELGCRWQVPAHRSNRAVCDRGELRVDVVVKGDSIARQDEQGVDLFVLSCSRAALA